MTPTVVPSPSAGQSTAASPTPITGPVTGTLTYREPHTLSGDAFAVVALVRGSARATENSIVASEIDRGITTVPVSFSLDLGGATIDPSATYTIQATIVDGENAWVTAHGIPVLTKGNPSNVAITLSYRPDLLKGAVTGQITRRRRRAVGHGLFDGRARRSRHRRLARHRCQGRRQPACRSRSRSRTRSPTSSRPMTTS